MKSACYGMAVVAVALIVAITACILPPEQMRYLAVVGHFLDALIPVLAVGALIKYVWACPGKCPVCGCSKPDTVA